MRCCQCKWEGAIQKNASIVGLYEFQKLYIHCSLWQKNPPHFGGNMILKKWFIKEPQNLHDEFSLCVSSQRMQTFSCVLYPDTSMTLNFLDKTLATWPLAAAEDSFKKEVDICKISIPLSKKQWGVFMPGQMGTVSKPHGISAAYLPRTRGWWCIECPKIEPQTGSSAMSPGLPLPDKCAGRPEILSWGPQNICVYLYKVFTWKILKDKFSYYWFHCQSFISNAHNDILEGA